VKKKLIEEERRFHQEKQNEEEQKTGGKRTGAPREADDARGKSMESNHSSANASKGEEEGGKGWQVRSVAPNSCSLEDTVTRSIEGCRLTPGEKKEASSESLRARRLAKIYCKEETEKGN